MVKFVTRAHYPQLLAPLAALLASTRSPKPSKKQIRNCFEETCRNIRRQLQQGLEEAAQNLVKKGGLSSPKRKGGGRPGSEFARAHDEFRRCAYILTQLVKQPEVWPTIKGIVHREFFGRPPSSKIARQISYILHHIIQTSASDGVETLDADALTTIANQLAYALKHEVPFPFVIGFLKEVRMDEAAHRQRAGLYEDWHPKWKAPAEGPKAAAETEAKPKKIASEVGKAGETTAKPKKTPTKADRSSRKVTT
jgi:hypothetical protein